MAVISYHTKTLKKSATLPWTNDDETNRISFVRKIFLIFKLKNTRFRKKIMPRYNEKAT